MRHVEVDRAGAVLVAEDVCQRLQHKLRAGVGHHLSPVRQPARAAQRDRLSPNLAVYSFYRGQHYCYMLTSNWVNAPGATQDLGKKCSRYVQTSKR